MPDDFHSQCRKLYDTRAAQMILYGRALGLSHAEAEDVLQETFLALMRLKAPPLRLDHYCLKAFRNRALNYRRGMLRRMLRELESRNWFEPSAADAREEAAMQQLAELPSEQREVIALKIWQEFTFEEIGGLTGVSPNTAAARYRYGLQKLRSCLNQMAYEDDQRIGKRTAGLGALPSLARAADQDLRPAES